MQGLKGHGLEWTYTSTCLMCKNLFPVEWYGGYQNWILTWAQMGSNKPLNKKNYLFLSYTRRHCFMKQTPLSRTLSQAFHELPKPNHVLYCTDPTHILCGPWVMCSLTGSHHLLLIKPDSPPERTVNQSRGLFLLYPIKPLMGRGWRGKH